MVIVAFFHLFPWSKGEWNRWWLLGATSIWRSGVTVVSPLSLQPPGPGFTTCLAHPTPISPPTQFHPPLCGLFSHGQNATKLDQGFLNHSHFCSDCTASIPVRQANIRWTALAFSKTFPRLLPGLLHTLKLFPAHEDLWMIQFRCIHVSHVKSTP